MFGFLSSCFGQSYYLAPSTEYSPDDNSFNEACKKGDANLAEIFLRQNPNWLAQQTGRNNNHPLSVAAQTGSPEIIKLLCEYGAHPNETITENGSTALHVASENGHPEVVRQLISHGATVDCPNQEGFTPLTMAFLNYKLGVAEVLLEHDANQHLQLDDPDAEAVWQSYLKKENNQGFTVLEIAASEGNVKTVKFLLDHGADKNHENKQGMTVLHCAAMNGSSGGIIEIMSHNSDSASIMAVDVNKPNEDGKTALYLASEKNHYDATLALLEYGATPIDCPKSLKQHYTMKDFRTVPGLTSLHIAAQNNDYKEVRIIIERGGIIDSAVQDGFTPLALAFLKGNYRVSEELLNAGAKDRLGHCIASIVTTIDWQGIFSERDNSAFKFTPLDFVSYYGYPKVAGMLLFYGADASLANDQGRIPLHQAALKGHSEVIHTIMSCAASRASINTQDNEGNTPLMLARQNNHQEAIKALEGYEAIGSTVETWL